MKRYRPDRDPAIATMPDPSNHENPVAYCRAMQKWAALEVDSRNNQRGMCIQDWFAEEVLILQESSLLNPAD